MINPPPTTYFLAFAIGACAALISPTSATANEYACRIPRALLCEGCANAISIALQPNGGCRVSFIPSVDQPPAIAKPPSENIELKVQTPPVALVHYTPTHGAARWRAHAVAWAKPASSAHCFVFNAQQYCE